LVARQCPSIAPEWEDPKGVPISAILFGGRRATNVPLVTEARSWDHGVFLGSIMSSETTAAAAGATGLVRFDPFAMLPFCGYNMADYFAHWFEIGQAGSKPGSKNRLPKLFWVNWFRRDADGRFMWPGFGDNARVLKWVLGRIDGQAAASDTPIGFVPAPGSIDTTGLDIDEATLADLVAVDPRAWRQEVALIREHYAIFGSRLPHRLSDQLADLDRRLTS
jgi:phosphoenolpyruvate carboxykinase (GTP)